MLTRHHTGAIPVSFSHPIHGLLVGMRLRWLSGSWATFGIVEERAASYELRKTHLSLRRSFQLFGADLKFRKA